MPTSSQDAACGMENDGARGYTIADQYFMLAVEPTAAPPPETHGGLHHIEQGMGDVGDGPRLPQTLHTIEGGIGL